MKPAQGGAMPITRLDISADEEGVFRVLDRDPDDIISFTCQDFGRFLTEFVSAMQSEDLTEDDG
jgi:hypothetical protein